MNKGKNVSNCDTCVNYIYDNENDMYCCHVNLDEDEMIKFVSYSFDNCPYYQKDDEYAIVRKQATSFS